MRKSKQVLAIELYDIQQDANEMIKNLKQLGDYLQDQTPPYDVEEIKPTISYLLDTEEIMSTQSLNQQFELLRIFIFAYYLTSPAQPIDFEQQSVIHRLYHLISIVVTPMEEKNKDLLILLLTKANEINFFSIQKDNTSISELFLSLIDIDVPQVVFSLRDLINSTNRIPIQVLQYIVDNIGKSAILESMIKSISLLKQNEIMQGIRSVANGEEVINAVGVLSEMLEVTPLHLFNTIRSDLTSENDKVRQATVKLISKTLLHQQINAETEPFCQSVLNRGKDRLPEIRECVVDFAFKIIQNFKEMKESGFRGDTLFDEIWKSTNSWITDPSNDVRILTLKGISKLKPKDIKIEMNLVATRLKDKCGDVRSRALKILYKLYDQSVDEYRWLEESILSLYPTIKDISLYGFELISQKRSLIDIMSGLKDRKSLLMILKDTNTFRMNLPSYKNEEARAKLSQFIDIKELDKIMKSVPKQFLDKALEIKNRKRIFKSIKEKLDGDSARLIMGLYQPNPIDTSEVLGYKDESIVSELAEIYYDEFEVEIPNMSKRMSKIDLIVLSKMKDVDFGNSLAGILESISKKAKTTKKSRKIALKAFSILFKNPHSDLLKDIKFGKDELIEEIKFFTRIKSPRLIPQKLIKAIDKEYASFTPLTIKWPLRLSSLFESSKCIGFHLHVLDAFPAEAFSSYIGNAHRCHEHNTPEVFRMFSSIIQHIEPDVRSRAIGSLSTHLKESTTPIQFLSLFALSATDPVKQNIHDAQAFLSQHIKMRRNILKVAKIGDNTQINPNYALPYLIHLLSYHKDYENDSPDFPTFRLYLRFFLECLCSGIKDFESILEIVWHMKFADDYDPDITPRMVNLCAIAGSIVREIGGGCEWDLSHKASEIKLPSRYFKPCDDTERIREDLLKFNLDSLKSPSSKQKVLNAGMSPLRSIKIKKTSKDTMKETEKSKKPDKKGKRTSKVEPEKRSAPASPKKPVVQTKTIKKSAPSTPKRLSKNRSNSPTLTSLKRK